MRLELSSQEAELLQALLKKDLDETKVEMHHTKNIAFKNDLQVRERMIADLTHRLEHV